VRVLSQAALLLSDPTKKAALRRCNGFWPRSMGGAVILDTATYLIPYRPMSSVPRWSFVAARAAVNLSFGPFDQVDRSNGRTRRLLWLPWRRRQVLGSVDGSDGFGKRTGRPIAGTRTTSASADPGPEVWRHFFCRDGPPALQQLDDPRAVLFAKTKSHRSVRLLRPPTEAGADIYLAA